MAGAARAHPGLELHLIGPLQSNKAREAVALFDAIHSVDRPSLCEALAKEIAKQGRRPAAVRGDQYRRRAAKGRRAAAGRRRVPGDCRDSYGLAIAGLMCIPPVDEAPAPHFALTAKIAARNGLKLLSMGMSADFATAIAFGATHVRVGTAIFGERKKTSEVTRRIAGLVAADGLAPPARDGGRSAPAR